MKKILLLLVLLLVAACGGPDAPTLEVTDFDESETAVFPPATDETEEEVEVEEEEVVEVEELPTSPIPADFTPASNPVEASEVRDFDHIKGATDPAVTIIEYGDYQ